MKTLETLLTDLGLTEHMEELSEWRDELLREKAVELQEVHTSHGEAIDALSAQHGASLQALATEKDEEINLLRDGLSEKSGRVEDLEEQLATAEKYLSEKSVQITTLQSAVSGANATLAAKNKTIQEKAAKVAELQAIVDAPEKERERLRLQAALAALDAPATTD